MMKSTTGQMALILLLMLAIFLQTEGVMPDIFAGDKEPIELSSVHEGLEFHAAFDSKGFTEKEELKLNVAITNRSNKPIGYYSGTTLYGIRGILGATLSSVDGIYKFTDKYILDTAGISSDTGVLQGELPPGKTINYDFTMLPYFIEDGEKNYADEGEYTLKLRYNKDIQEVIEAEFPITVIKRFGRISIKV